MNYKNLIIFSGVISTIIIFTFGYLLYSAPIEEQKRIHNLPLVKNCIPIGPDEVVDSFQIGNYTHIFDLRSCEWTPMEK